jgi:1-aminocyclopropane-1-carboxylate deaminase
VAQIDLLNDFFNDGNSLAVLRLDLPDPLSGGNKSFKLKYNLDEMKWRRLSRLLTFGGAFSNHIVAVAAAGKNNNFETIGIIRGDELHEDSNAVLKYASECGMKLFFVSREDYRRRNDPEFIDELQQQHGPAYVLPEGGSNAFAVKGTKEILSAATDPFDVIVCPVGTGATLAGIIAAAKPHQEITGVAVLEGKDYLEKEVATHLQNEIVRVKWSIAHEFTFGGYARSSAELESFITEMQASYNLPLDPVYSGKALFALREMGKSSGKKYLFIHTGGYAFPGGF